MKTTDLNVLPTRLLHSSEPARPLDHLEGAQGPSRPCIACEVDGGGDGNEMIVDRHHLATNIHLSWHARSMPQRPGHSCAL